MMLDDKITVTIIYKDRNKPNRFLNYSPPPKKKDSKYEQKHSVGISF